ncbi:MAG: c-type cytochrome [Rhodobacteraceae bacterium]|jgi:mono/diheme cytochrome c family protein|nr:c-type cytochrome [Paracoccaceae bacterium]
MSRIFPPIAAALLALAPAGAAAASDQPDGAEAYRGACAGCHGAEARGDGPLAILIAVPTPDLTRLAAAAGGRFPRWEVIHAIDGQTGLRGHGGPMPIFGALMSGDMVLIEDPGQGLTAVSARIVAIADWLESIQRSD